ncbi:MAG: GNAT family N-acetyltransferase [Pseudomonadota bacterium]
MIDIREARPADADEIAAVLVASITQLCKPDHGGDAALIAAWTANKTRENVMRWIFTAGSTLLSAKIDGAVAGVASYEASGQILLNYVSPGHRGTGVSTALLAEMEAALAAAGCTDGRLVSTKTALDFYQARGWVTDGPTTPAEPVRGYPMTKRLGTG